MPIQGRLPTSAHVLLSQCVAPYLSAAVQQSSVAGLVKVFLHKCNADAGSSDEEEDDGVDLCNCEFSLAYGGSTPAL